MQNSCIHSTGAYRVGSLLHMDTMAGSATQIKDGNDIIEMPTPLPPPLSQTSCRTRIGCTASAENVYAMCGPCSMHRGEARLIPGEEPRRGPPWVSLEIFGTHFDGQEQHFNRIWSKESTVLGLARLRVRPYISLFLQACSPWNSLQSVKNLSCWIERKAAKRPPTPTRNLVEI